MKKTITILLLFLAVAGYGQADLNGRIPLRQIYPIDTADANINKPQWQAYIESLVPADSYISNVTESSNSITFTGVGSAFNGSVGSIAKTDISQTFQASHTPGYLLTINNTSTASDSKGLQVITAGTPAFSEIATFSSNSTGSLLTTLLLVGDGNVRVPRLPAGTQTNSVYIDGSGYLYEGAAPSGGITDGDKGDITVSSSGTVWTIDDNTIGTAELNTTGTASTSTFLRGDMAWVEPTNYSTIADQLTGTFSGSTNSIGSAVEPVTVTDCMYRGTYTVWNGSSILSGSEIVFIHNNSGTYTLTEREILSPTTISLVFSMNVTTLEYSLQGLTGITGSARVVIERVYQ